MHRPLFKVHASRKMFPQEAETWLTGATIMAVEFKNVNDGAISRLQSAVRNLRTYAQHKKLKGLGKTRRQ